MFYSSLQFSFLLSSPFLSTLPVSKNQTWKYSLKLNLNIYKTNCNYYLTRLLMSKLTGALCSVLSVKQLMDCHCSCGLTLCSVILACCINSLSSLEAMSHPSPLSWTLSRRWWWWWWWWWLIPLPDSNLTTACSRLIALGAEKLNVFVDSKFELRKWNECSGYEKHAC